VKKGRSKAASNLSKASRINRNKLLQQHKQAKLDKSRSIFGNCPRVVVTRF
jgi:hypothetical protein